MNGVLYNLTPIIVSLTLGQIIYINIDARYKLTSKISLKLKIQQRWKAFFVFV